MDAACLPSAYLEAEPVTRLTKRTVDAAQADATDVYIWDDDLAGFGLRIKPRGVKSFFIQYRTKEGGRSRRYTLGQHGILTADKARRLAREKLADVEHGEDPAEERKRALRAMSIRDLCREYLEKAEAGLILTRRGDPKKHSTLYTDRGRIERHIIPLIGHRSIRDLTTADVGRFLQDVIKGKSAADIKTKSRGRAIVKGGPGTGARTLGLFGGILSYAVNEGYRSDNPARGIIRPRDKRRRIHLDEAKYRAVGTALEAAEDAGERWQALLAIRLIALTGCRRGEIEQLQRREVDLDARAIQLGDSKTGFSVRPLGSAAVAVLRDALRRSSSRYVFPSVSSEDKPFAGLPKAWDRITEGVVGDLSPHGLRHAFAGTAEDLGFSVPTIKGLLGHAAAGTTEGYIYRPDTALVAAADRVSGHVQRAMTGRGQEASVVRLKHA